MTKFEPAWEQWPDAGVYQLHVYVPAASGVRIGTLGAYELVGGRYVYTGRAARGLAARIQRHLRIAELGAGACGARLHWHIDYLLDVPGARVERVVLASRTAGNECAVAQSTPGAVVCPKFGASDCRAGCVAHLVLVQGCAERVDWRVAPSKKPSTIASRAATKTRHSAGNE